MWPNPQETPDLVTYTEKILNGKLPLFCWTTAFPVNIHFAFQDAFKASLRCSQDVFARCLLEDVLKMSCKHVLKASWRRLGRWKIVKLKKSLRRLQDVLENKKYLLGVWNIFQKLHLCSQKTGEDFRETSEMISQIPSSSL